MTPYNLLVALTTTYTTNILNPATITGGVNGGSGALYIIAKHIRIINKTGNDRTFRLFRGATGANAAGTEFMGYDRTVEANKDVEWFGQLLFKSTDFLVGGADAATALTMEIDGDIGVEL